MAKIPDMSNMSNKLKEFKEKIDFQGIVDSVKSIITPDMSEQLGDDPIAGKLKLIAEAAQRAQQFAQQQQEEFAKIDNLVSSIYLDLAQAKKAQSAKNEVPAENPEKSAKKTNKD